MKDGAPSHRSRTIREWRNELLSNSRMGWDSDDPNITWKEKSTLNVIIDRIHQVYDLLNSESAKLLQMQL